ncbi:hypothetical protein [Desulforamulus ruminis]|uniref:Uncharacterized protein n=1 Tax=Desulforamulus ruminis (strain ATCC 23193 / DSM 2154 / NCIMB 8452 / DL) TaxID=696281 RepID=F6DTG7_DESRL|nr:hypothetical protein [Desulforamulus ruminis]AEG60029.1 hypothetical protein Desru_1765 [Desulforamulus ruminis DSM 2154]
MFPSEARELRGFILTMCKNNYPHGCSEKLIQIAVGENQFTSSPALIHAHLEYLEEKGYVRLEELQAKGLGISRKVVYITAKGIDLLEGSIALDPGVLVMS